MFKFQYTVLELIHSGLLAHKSKFTPDLFRGSASFKYDLGELYLKKELKPKKDICNENSEPKQKQNQDTKRLHRLNKSFVKRKLFAFFNLKATQKICKFWTITFPIGTQDDICYKLFNLWLTRCRQKFGLKDYLWVAERQKNNTIHFHMCINIFMPIQEVNNFMRISINNCIISGEIKREDKSWLNYNGINVSKKLGKGKGIGGYMTKYCTKNDTEAYRLLSYCSKSISALFTSQTLTEEQLLIYEQRGAIKQDKDPIFRCDFIDFYKFNFSTNLDEFKELFALNDSIYNAFYN